MFSIVLFLFGLAYLFVYVVAGLIITHLGDKAKPDNFPAIALFTSNIFLIFVAAATAHLIGW